MIGSIVVFYPSWDRLMRTNNSVDRLLTVSIISESGYGSHLTKANQEEESHSVLATKSSQVHCGGRSR